MRGISSLVFWLEASMARRWHRGKIALTVIASKAKQSMAPRRMDCFVATLLAMTLKQRLLAAETNGW
jgi:hypothetical protein